MHLHVQTLPLGRPTHWVALVGTLVVLACAGSLARAQAPLTLAETLQLAESRSGAISAQQAAKSAAQEAAVAAGRLPDPMLRAGVSNLPVTGGDAFSLTRDFMTMRSIGVAQEFTRGEKRASRQARFERTADVADATRAVVRANVQKAAALAWLERHYRERLLDLLQQQRVEARLQIDAAEAAYRANRGMQADVFAARSAVALIDDRIRQAQGQLASARLALARWVGSAEERPLGEPPSIAVTRLALDHVEPGLAHHPELQLMQRQEDVARAEVDMARADKRTDWSVEVMYSQRGPGYSKMVSVLVSVPLQWDQKNRQDREVASRLAQLEQMRAQREDTTREHLAETQRWVQEWQADLDRLALYERELVPLAAERTAAALAAYRGNGPLNAVLEARRAEIDTRMERLRLELETAALWAQLEYLIPAGDAQQTDRPANQGAKQ